MISLLRDGYVFLFTAKDEAQRDLDEEKEIQ